MTERAAYIACALATFVAAASAAAQAPGVTTIESSVKSLAAAGPWIAWVLTAGACVWLHRELKGERADCRAEIKALSARVDALHSERVKGLERGADALLAHAEAARETVATFTSVLHDIRDDLRRR
jgi:hypothetical protein